MTPLAQRIEAVLFVSGESVALAELQETLAISPVELSYALAELQQALRGHGLALVISDLQAQLATSTTVASFICEFIGQPEQSLSRAAAETLALIAYRGPISRLTIEGVRGVDSRRMVRQLVARGLVAREPTGTDVPRYCVTELFLRQVGVRERHELPNWDTLSTADTPL